MQRNKELQSTQPAEKNPQSTAPLYRKVANHIRRCIIHGTLGKRVNLTESNISSILNISRTPARKALTLLEQEKLIHKKSTRGYVVGSRSESSLLKLTPQMFQLSSEDDFLHPVDAWQGVYEKIENEIVRQSILSKRRLNAHLLAQYYACNRSMIQEVLYKFEVSGLMQKHYHSKWTIVPLDDKRLNAIFDVRSWLEPNLISQGIPEIPKEVLHTVIDSHKDALSRFPDTTGVELNQLELDMHDILEAIDRRNKDESRLRLQAHLIKARHKVIERLGKFREVVQENPTEFMKPWVK